MDEANRAESKPHYRWPWFLLGLLLLGLALAALWMSFEIRRTRQLRDLNASPSLDGPAQRK